MAAGFTAILVFTAVLIALSFPAGTYAFFFTHLSVNYTWATPSLPYLWIGPVFVAFPFAVSIGVTFLLATAVYIVMFAYTIWAGVNPLRAMVQSLKKGFASFFSSPFLVSVIAIGFLVFTATVVDSVVSGTAPPSDPLAELWGLAYAPMVEEFGFRMIMIGLVVALVSLDRGFRGFLKSLWRPSAAYEGNPGVKYAVAGLAVISSVTFGYTHVAAGWTPGKFFEATYGGFVLAFLYVKYGFHMSVLAHWGIDYFGSAFAFYGAGVSGIPWNSLTQTYWLEQMVNIDLLAVLGLSSFLVVLYMLIVRLAIGAPSEAHKTPPQEDRGQT